MFFALAFLLPLSAHSETKGGRFEVSPFLGYNFFESTQNLNNNLLLGGRVSYNFTELFGLEGTVEFINTNVHDVTITGTAKGQYRFPMDKVDLFFYNLDGVFNLIREHDLTLFAVGGIGRVNYNASIATGDMTTFDLGVGGKFWMTENFALRLDLRDNMVTEFFNESKIFENAYQNLNATVGLSFAFGGETEKKEAAKEPVKEATPVVVFVAEEPKVIEKVKIIAAAPAVEEKIVVLAFEDVHFNFDKSTMTDEAKEIVTRSIQILKDNPKAHIRIAGYSSAAGTGEYNQGLSERRAENIEYYLIKSGIVSADRISTIGYGETMPAEHEDVPKEHYSTAAKANMRVLFEVIVK
jgi:OOP family OmpA-OmpF porin